MRLAVPNAFGNDLEAELRLPPSPSKIASIAASLDIGLEIGDSDDVDLRDASRSVLAGA
jgi:hypothetical protein